MSSTASSSSALSPLPSPLQDYRAQLRQGFIDRPSAPPGGEVPPATPEYSRGRMTLLDQGDVRIELELGPLIVHHLFRGTSPALQVSVWA